MTVESGNPEVFRALLSEGMLAHIATTDGTALYSSACWYATRDRGRVIVFTSRADRRHSENIRLNGLVAASIVPIELEGLGQKTQGIFLRGAGRECEAAQDVESAYAAYADRWPQVSSMFSAADVLAGSTRMRMYEIAVGEYELVDEVTDPVQVKKPIPLESL